MYPEQFAEQRAKQLREYMRQIFFFLFKDKEVTYLAVAIVFQDVLSTNALSHVGEFSS